MTNRNLSWITGPFWWCVRVKQPLRQVSLACMLVLGSITLAGAQNLVTGQVFNATTVSGMPGVTVTVLKGAQELGRASSNDQGYFQVALELPKSDQPQNLTLEAVHPEFVSVSRTIQLVSGRLAGPALVLHLLPRSLTNCKIPSRRCVVVGYFLPPRQEQVTELSDRIAKTLTFDLLTKLQPLHVSPSLQPVFLACEEAKIRAVEFGRQLAEALEADAFIFGTVKSAPPGYDVSIFVCDSYGLFDTPVLAKNQHVDLYDLSSAQLQPQTHAAILAALTAGYIRQGKFIEGFQVTEAARQLLGELPPKLQELRSQCQNKLPQRGLLPGGQP
jgi:hypothetical protein